MQREVGTVSKRCEDNASGEEDHYSITLRIPRFSRKLRGKLMIDGSAFMCLIGNLDGVKNCPNCGGLPVELQLVHEGKRYLFTCYQVLSRAGKVIVETDYDRLAEYLAERKEFLLKKGKGVKNEGFDVRPE